MSTTRLWTIHRCSCQPSTKSRQICTSNSGTFKDKTAQHIGSCSQTTINSLSFNWKTYFSSSASLTWTESPTWWSSSSWGHQWQEWHSQKWQDKGCQTVATAMYATGGVQTTPHRTHTRAPFSRCALHM